MSRIGQAIGSNRKDIWAALATFGCTLTLNAFIGISLDSTIDTLSQILLGTISPNLWWVIFAGKATVIGLVLVINYLYWIEEDLIGLGFCPSAVLVTVPWATASFLTTQFAENALFASLTVTFMLTLGIFLVVPMLSELEFTSNLAYLSMFTAGLLSSLLGIMHLAGIPNPLTSLLIPAFNGFVGEAWRSILFGVPLVAALNILTNETVKKTVIETGLEDVYREYDIFPENDSIDVIVYSSIIGVLVNLYFTTVFIGEPVNAVPGLTLAEFIAIFI